MKLYSDSTVRIDWGPRPAGKPDRCFYCLRMVGDKHKVDCVILKKSVVIRYEIEMLVSVPECWSGGDVDFHRNESSFCMSNDFEQIMEEDNSLKHSCFICHRASATFIREATEEDIKKLRPEGMEFPE